MKVSINVNNNRVVGIDEENGTEYPDIPGVFATPPTAFLQDYVLEGGKLVYKPDETEVTGRVRGARRDKYPSITDQLDDLYHQGAFSEEMSAKIKKVKDDYPFPA